jgi:hypothetical protein
MKLGGERFRSQERVSQSVFKSKYVANQKREVQGGLYSPQGNLPVGAVRDPDMSRLEAGHVRPTSLESGSGTRHVRSRDLVAEESG